MSVCHGPNGSTTCCPIYGVVVLILSQCLLFAFLLEILATDSGFFSSVGGHALLRLRQLGTFVCPAQSALGLGVGLVPRREDWLPGVVYGGDVEHVLGL